MKTITKSQANGVSVVFYGLGRYYKSSSRLLTMWTGRAVGTQTAYAPVKITAKPLQKKKNCRKLTPKTDHKRGHTGSFSVF